MSFLKIHKTTSYKTEQMETVISILCFLNDIKLSKTDITVLAYFMAYKINSKTDQLLITNKIVKDITSLRNVKTKLHKLGFLKRTKELYKSYELNLHKDFDLSEKEITLFIKLDNN